LQVAEVGPDDDMVGDQPAPTGGDGEVVDAGVEVDAGVPELGLQLLGDVGGHERDELARASGTVERDVRVAHGELEARAFEGTPAGGDPPRRSALDGAV